MRRAAVLLVAAGLVLAGAAVLRWGPGSPARAPGAVTSPAAPTGVAPAPRVEPAPPTVTPAPLARAREMLAAIEARGGQPLAGYVGGRTFHNRERRLPPGRYREYDLHPRAPGQDRGPERLVVDQTTGRAYYTDDHYRTFVPLN